jgi:hypothetical protein
MLSQKARYALRAMIELARESGQVTAGELAVRADAPRKFLEAILLTLSRQGLVTSRRGKFGGYLERGSGSGFVQQFGARAGRDQLRRDHPPGRRALGPDPLRQPYGLSPLRGLPRPGDLRLARGPASGPRRHGGGAGRLQPGRRGGRLGRRTAGRTRILTHALYRRYI